MDLVGIFEATVLNVGHDEMMLALAGSPSRVDDFEQLLRPYGIVEIQRTGRVALPKLKKTP
jgi:acetolactate synthase I/III small subunit